MSRPQADESVNSTMPRVAVVTPEKLILTQTSWSKSQKISGFLLTFCGLYVFVFGLFLFIAAIFSYFSPSSVVLLLLGHDHKSAPLEGWAWAQTAVAFGMHSYADIFSGISMIWAARGMNKSLPRLVMFWNTTRFVISLLWLLKFLEGTYMYNSLNHKKNIFTIDSVYGIGLAGLLAMDAFVIRPTAIYIQRQLADTFPHKPFHELHEYNTLSFFQKFCRAFFYYEAVLSGISGATYFMFPQLFYWLYGFPESSSSFVTFWFMSQFGVLVFSFGLYQMQAEIDQNVGMITVWLLLDYVWLYYFWDGVASQWGPWNPFLFQGANFWCQSAFHADSTLAIMRTLFLLNKFFSCFGGTEEKIKVD